MADPADDPITTHPTRWGSFGRAWRIDVRMLLIANGRDPEGDAGIDLWLVEAPRAHPVWHSYMMLMMHLRPLPDVADPIIYLPGATHEFELWALSPDAKRQDIIDTGGGWMRWRLEPMNFAAQIIATDEEAKDRLLGSVLEILQGTISPDTDYRQWWVQSWGDSMLKERKHE